MMVLGKAQMLVDMTSPARAKFADTQSPTTPGMSHGGFDYPVTGVSLCDVIKWCNALSERAGLDPVYEYYLNGTSGTKATYKKGKVVNGVYTNPVPIVNYDANGFRIPHPFEVYEIMETAYIHPYLESVEYGNFIKDNSREGIHVNQIAGLALASMHPVGSNPASLVAGTYDLAGNASEWNYLNDSQNTGTEEAFGGDFTQSSNFPTFKQRGFGIAWRDARFGFRIYRSVPE